MVIAEKFALSNLPITHSKRIYTEEKAKVVAAVWGGTEFIKILATLAICTSNIEECDECILVQFILFFFALLLS